MSVKRSYEEDAVPSENTDFNSSSSFHIGNVEAENENTFHKSKKIASNPIQPIKSSLDPNSEELFSLMDATSLEFRKTYYDLTTFSRNKILHHIAVICLNSLNIDVFELYNLNTLPKTEVCNRLLDSFKQSTWKTEFFNIITPVAEGKHIKNTILTALDNLLSNYKHPDTSKEHRNECHLDAMHCHMLTRTFIRLSSTNQKTVNNKESLTPPLYLYPFLSISKLENNINKILGALKCGYISDPKESSYTFDFMSGQTLYILLPIIVEKRGVFSRLDVRSLDCDISVNSSSVVISYILSDLLTPIITEIEKLTEECVIYFRGFDIVTLKTCMWGVIVQNFGKEPTIECKSDTITGTTGFALCKQQQLKCIVTSSEPGMYDVRLKVYCNNILTA